MSADGLNMPQRYPSITHPRQCCSPKGMGARPLNANFIKRFPKYPSFVTLRVFLLLPSRQKNTYFRTG